VHRAHKSLLQPTILDLKGDCCQPIVASSSLPWSLFAGHSGTWLVQSDIHRAAFGRALSLDPRMVSRYGSCPCRLDWMDQPCLMLDAVHRRGRCVRDDRGREWRPSVKLPIEFKPRCVPAVTAWRGVDRHTWHAAHCCQHLQSQHSRTRSLQLEITWRMSSEMLPCAGEVLRTLMTVLVAVLALLCRIHSGAWKADWVLQSISTVLRLCAGHSGLCPKIFERRASTPCKLHGYAVRH
jgi:hypothetical protein